MTDMDLLIDAFRAEVVERSEPGEHLVEWRLVRRADRSAFLLLKRAHRDGLRLVEGPDEDFMSMVRADVNGFSAWNHPASEVLWSAT